jgi:Family of unknown function (DUF5946)
MTTTAEQDAYNELASYTLAHHDTSFIHQYVVDAFTAQTADEHTKPIAITFALVGLYLAVERDFTGKQVQRVHMELAKKRKQWLTFQAPVQKGTVSIFDVVATPAGPERDTMIRKWCASVWEAWKETQPPIRDLLKTELGI